MAIPQPTVFFNVVFHMFLDEDDDSFATLRINNCFFIKRDGLYVTTIEELNDLFRFNRREFRGYDVLIVRCNQQRNCTIPDLHNFNAYPELWDINSDRPNRPRIQYIDENEPQRIKYLPF